LALASTVQEELPFASTLNGSTIGRVAGADVAYETGGDRVFAAVVTQDPQTLSVLEAVTHLRAGFGWHWPPNQITPRLIMTIELRATGNTKEAREI
jgi:hypothetical protein